MTEVVEAVMETVAETVAEAAIEPDAAYTWAVAAATEATRVPADGEEAEAWTVRGWAEVALGCAVLGVAEGFAGLDEVVRAHGVRRGDRHAVRLRALRGRAGAVPGFYPEHAALRPRRAVSPPAWRMCGLLGEFCDQVMTISASAPTGGAAGRGGSRGGEEGGVGRGVRPVRSTPSGAVTEAEEHLRWGERLRPSPVGGYAVVVRPDCGGAVWRTWLRVPRGAGMADVLLEAPRRATPEARRIWRGVHDGAHLDHLAAVGGERLAPSRIEFGEGLLVAESYAMAVEILALVQCALGGRARDAAVLRAGLRERMARLPGHDRLPRPMPYGTAGRAASPAPAEGLDALPLLAETYVTGPLTLLAGTDDVPEELLPGRLADALRRRWAWACAAHPAAAALTERVRGLAPPRRARPSPSPARPVSV
ncbi:hypothetical protein SAMN05421505_10838 [Sinosporangium album]|uniref:Uncharacterized protein n=1 Tax=Sinosporangium album TaxID=504805 RepID=A0A1G7X4Q1_9ACTN|nr:hypothetical protein [Sinosporangium album]SDG79174.1 hypothetical protein SAMN05421505_10838 [Sinosporangium album]